MGVWGVSIYSCDIAEDVKEACNVIFAVYDIEDGNNRLFSAFGDILNQDFVDNEYASFWYALSYWQWQHGMLNAYVQEKALSLLENYTGLDEWEGVDILKRRKILDRLKEQLLQAQPEIKKPRLKVSKAKHVPGDIIIFCVAAENDVETDTKWKIESLTPPLFFESTKYYSSSYQNIEGYDARGKWMALLCVGTVKEKISEYVDDIFDEHSLYVWYDYLSYEQPSVDELHTCGFLPYVNWKWKDFNRNITENVEWGYEFTVVCEKFKRSSEIDRLFVINKLDEVNRYKKLVSKKNYSHDYWGGFTVSDMFSAMFEEKNRAVLIGEEYDNLLSAEIQAPILLPPREVDVHFQKYIKNLN